MHKDASIIIVCHHLNYGATDALRDYLINHKAKDISFLGLPFFNQRNFVAEQYHNGKKIKKYAKKRGFQFGVADYIIDFFDVIFYFFQSRKKYDYYVGAGALDCFTGVILKKIGFVKNVIFYSIDFVPKRFANSFLNTIFHGLEKYCVKNSDYVWNVSPRIAEGRKKFLHISDKQYKQIVVPIGVWNEKVKKRNNNQIKKHQILFLGHLLEKQGVQIVLDALPMVIKKIPDLHFIIGGGGEYLEALENKVKDLSLEKYVTFTGWITKREIIDEMMSESAVAIATYKPEKEKLTNFTYYADPTKLKDYLSAGLPIILTDISYNAKEIAEKKCGILVQYDSKIVASSITKLLTNNKLLLEYRNNALKYATSFDWNVIFDNVIN